MPKRVIPRRGDKPVKSLLSEDSDSKVDRKQIFNDFLAYAKKALHINSKVRVVLSNDKKTVLELKALGVFDPNKKPVEVWVYEGPRLIADIIRTLAHELVHVKQNEAGMKLDGSDGSKNENEANAKAGVLLRWYGRENPAIYN